MAGLIDSLTTATASLDAQRLGMDVVGQNIANVNTPGYARRTLQLAEVPPAGPGNAGGGVQIEQVQAARDLFVEARLRTEQQAQSQDDAVSNALAVVQASLGQPGAGLDGQLSALFDAFSTLASDPTSLDARDAVVHQAQTLASGFHDLSDTLTTAEHEADNEVRGDVDQINQLAQRVADLNAQIGSANTLGLESAQDQLGETLSSLAKLANVSVTTHSNGTVDLTIGSGRLLVSGTTAVPLTTEQSAGTGLTAIKSGDDDITDEITGGEVGGLLEVRDTLVPGYQTSLDQLAYGLASAVNSVHESGTDLTGAQGGAFFAVPATSAGAASAIQVSSAIASDSSLVAASATGAPGDNGTARAIAALRDTPSLLGGTATPDDVWGAFVYRVGSDASDAQAASTTHQQVISQLQALRDSTSGVSIDDEAASLMKYQRAYEASARYFSAINSSLDVLMQMVQ